MPGHQVETAYERGWAELSNGDLIRAAEDAGFEVMITTDKSIRYQQNLSGRNLAFIVLSTNDWTRIRNWKPLLVDALSRVASGRFVEIEIPPG